MIAVLFEAEALPEAQQRYFQLAADLKPLLADVCGFISIERFESLTTKGKYLSLSWWEDEDAIAVWKQNLMHQVAQQEGKDSVFSFFRIRVACVFRDYSFEKGQYQHV